MSDIDAIVFAIVVAFGVLPAVHASRIEMLQTRRQKLREELAQSGLSREEQKLALVEHFEQGPNYKFWLNLLLWLLFLLWLLSL